MMDILGLMIPEMTETTKQEIDRLVESRECNLEWKRNLKMQIKFEIS